jgi:hypothetical protein
MIVSLLRMTFSYLCTPCDSFHKLLLPILLRPRTALQGPKSFSASTHYGIVLVRWHRARTRCLRQATERGIPSEVRRTLPGIRLGLGSVQRVISAPRLRIGARRHELANSLVCRPVEGRLPSSPAGLHSLIVGSTKPSRDGEIRTLGLLLPKQAR